MASDSMMRIAEAENQAASIEEEAKARANAIIADAERLSVARSEEIAKAAEAEYKKLILDAEMRRLLFEKDQNQACESDLIDLRSRVSPKIPLAIAQVRDILIGKE